MPLRSRDVLREGMCVAIYATLSVIATFPLAADFRHTIPRGGDAWQFYWNLWWVKRALVDLHTSPYFTADVHQPIGASLYFHTLNLLPSAVVVPISATLGLAAAFNAIVLASFMLSGYCTYRLALYVLRRIPASPQWALVSLRQAAFVAGLVFAFSSYRFVHALGHLDLLCTFWIPLYALLFLKTLREPGWPNAVCAGAVMAATAFTSFYYVLFLIVWSVIALAVELARIRIRLAQLVRVAVAAATFFVLTSPLLSTLLVRGNREGRVLDPGADVERFSTDLMALVTPSPLSWFGESFAPAANALLARPGTNLELIAFTGFTALVLGCAGALRWRGAALLWVLTFVVFVALALGPTPHVFGAPLPALSVVMPYQLLTTLPYGDLPRVPGRFIVVAHLATAILAAGGVATVLRRASTERARVLTAAITTGVMIEQLPRPFPTVDVAVPAYFERLRAEQDAGVLLEVPIPADPSIYPKRMLYQTIHQKPVFGGYLSRSLPPLAFDRFPGFAEFKQLSLDADVIAKTSGNARASLATFGAGRVVIEKRLLKEDELGQARMVGESLLGPPVYEDAQILAYDVRPEPRTSALWLGEGWSYLERLEQGDRRDRWRWMSERARFGVAAPSRGFVRLRLTAHAFDETRRLRIARDGVELTTIAVGLGIRRYETPPFELTAGVHYLDVESLDGAKSPGNDPRRLSVAIHEVVLESVEFGQ